MGSIAILLVLCVLAGAAAGRGEPCAVDVAGTRGDCRSIGECPELLRIARTAVPSSHAVGWLRELAKKCPWSAADTLQVCCRSEVTRSATPTAPPRIELPTEAQQCGLPLSSAKVVGGEDAAIGEFPWMASIQYTYSPGGVPKHGCGGTLISSRHVLTAAHCVSHLSRRAPSHPELTASAVILGEVDFNSAVDCLADEPDMCADEPLEVRIEAIFAHPEFEPSSKLALPNDIAVLRLEREVVFTDFIRPVCLLTDLSVMRGGQSDWDLSPGRRGSVAGWGQSEVGSDVGFTPVLQKGSLLIQEVEECEKVFRLSLPNRICAGAGPNRTDTCRGDSGGPLMVPLSYGTVWYQTGISSFGASLCGNVAGYTRVFDYADWIVEQINK